MPEIAPGQFVLHFPAAGLDRSRAFGRQPNREVAGVYRRTTPVGVNVRGFEQTAQRLRGGSRCGLSRLIDAKPGGLTWATQHLAALSAAGVTGVQSSISGRAVVLLVVVQGVIYRAFPESTAWESTTNSTGNSPPLNFNGIMASTSCIQQHFFVDGTNAVRYVPRTNTVHLWTPTAGSIPRDDLNNGPRLICTWRGRIVLSGLLRDPQNWFMSRVSDPFDFDYLTQSNDPAQAIAGNNARMGLIGDVVTCLIPASDDVLIFGGDSTIWRMQGDPFYGGQLDKVTDRVGMAWNVPYCMDPQKNIYFASNTGSIYAMAAEGRGEPVRISQPIEQDAQSVNTGTKNIVMEWDDNFQELHVWRTTLSAATATDEHLVWEARTKAWWIDRYAQKNHNPLCCCVLDGNRPEDRVLLVGGWDGYVRKVDPNATTDDGVPIEHEVLIGPLRTETFDEIITDQIQAVLGEDSGDVTLELLAGKTPELALAATPIPVGTLRAGRSPTFSRRVAGHAVYVRASGTDPYACEEIRVRLHTKGKVRRRVAG